MNTEMEQALAMLERAMSKELQDSIHEDKSIKEIQNSINEKAEIVSKLNRLTGNQWDDMEKCTRACLKIKNCTKRMFYFPFS